MKHPIILLLFVSVSFAAKAQQTLPDSLKTAFQLASNDSVKFKASRAIYTFYEETNRDSALHYAELRYAIAKNTIAGLKKLICWDKWHINKYILVVSVKH